MNEDTSMTATVQYGPFSITLFRSVMERFGLTPGQQVSERQMKDAVYMNKLLGADEAKKEVLGSGSK